MTILSPIRKWSHKFPHPKELPYHNCSAILLHLPTIVNNITCTHICTPFLCRAPPHQLLRHAATQLRPAKPHAPHPLQRIIITFSDRPRYPFSLIGPYIWVTPVISLVIGDQSPQSHIPIIFKMTFYPQTKSSFLTLYIFC